MSRGLSQQQRAILGLGVRINRAANGGEIVPIRGEIVMPDEPRARWSIPTVIGVGLAEVTTRYVLHLLHGVPIRTTMWRDGYVRAAGKPHEAYVTDCEIGVPGFFVHDDRSRSLKATTARAIQTLLKRRHVVHMPDVISRAYGGRWPERAFVAALSSEERLALSWGYALTDAGIAIGKDHEPDLDDVTVLRAVKALQRYPDAYYNAPMIETLDGMIAAAEARLAA
jgi:hypothetical protein